MAKRDVDEWFWQVGSELHRLAEEIGTTRTRIAQSRAWEPRIDLVDDGEKVAIRAELAGTRVDDLSLNYLAERNALLLRGYRDEQWPIELGRPEAYQFEVLYGEFEREIRLPEGEFDPDSIRAQYRNGFLYVVIPRRRGFGRGR